MEARLDSSKIFGLVKLPLHFLFLQLYDVVVNRNCLVSSQYKVYNEVRIWNVMFRSDFGEEHLDEYNALMF